jgi:antitoxin PrlF
MTSTVTRKGQVTIPKRIREEMDLHLGDRVLFLVRDDEIVLKPMRVSILDLQGTVAPKNRPEDFDRVRATVKRRHARKVVEDG